ncbi:hypothetical protein [Nitrosopumilus sp. S4]
MKLKNEFGMKSLLASCPNCSIASLYCGMIPTEIKSLANKEVLFCKSCKFVIPVDEYKNLLLSV